MVFFIKYREIGLAPLVKVLNPTYHLDRFTHLIQNQTFALLLIPTNLTFYYRWHHCLLSKQAKQITLFLKEILAESLNLLHFDFRDNYLEQFQLSANFES